jgi:hypothetical protein
MFICLIVIPLPFPSSSTFPLRLHKEVSLKTCRYKIIAMDNFNRVTYYVISKFSQSLVPCVSTRTLPSYCRKC